MFVVIYLYIKYYLQFQVKFSHVNLSRSFDCKRIFLIINTKT